MPRWTPELRLKQAEKIRALCPWTKSTGPRTEEGKARSARNAWKGGVRAAVRATVAHGTQLLRQMEASTRALISSFCQKRVSSPPRTLAPPPPRPLVPLPGLAAGFPPDREFEGLFARQLMAMAERLRGDEGLPEAGVFSSFC